jgi:Bacterial PH domain
VTSIEFRAPWSASLRATTVSSVVVIALATAALIFASLHLSQPGLMVMIALPLLLLAVAFASRVRGYTLTEGAIYVRRGVWDLRLPLAGLRSVTGDVDAMRGSLQFGNWGLFSLTGRWWNKKLGWYRSYATDPSRAVVLRYAQRTVVITPHDPQHFIMRARTLIKAVDFPK